MIEDEWCNEEVVAHLTLFPGEIPNKLFSSYMSGLMSHHILTAFAYSYCLWSHKLSALAVFGLLFEAPVLITNTRDILTSFNAEIQYPFTSWSRSQYKLYSNITQLVFHCTRTSFCFLWPLSLCIWLPQLSTLSVTSQIVYHFLGAGFCSVNLIIYRDFLTRTLCEDAVRMGLMRPQTMWKQFKVPQADIDAFLNAKSADSGEAPLAVASSSSKSQQRSITPSQLKEHNHERSLWVLIDGFVYDVTSFVDRHPGGRKALLSVAGSDASVDFADVGHSAHARQLLEKYKVGSYSTANDGFLAPEKTDSNLLAPQDSSLKPASRGSASGVGRSAAQYVTAHLNKKSWFEFTHGILPTEGRYEVFKDYSFDSEWLFPATLAAIVCAVFLVQSGNALGYDGDFVRQLTLANALLPDGSGAQTYFNRIGLDIVSAQSLLASMSTLALYASLAYQGAPCVALPMTRSSSDDDDSHENRPRHTLMKSIAVSSPILVAALIVTVSLLSEMALLSLPTKKEAFQFLSLSLLVSFTWETSSAWRVDSSLIGLLLSVIDHVALVTLAESPNLWLAIHTLFLALFASIVRLIMYRRVLTQNGNAPLLSVFLFSTLFLACIRVYLYNFGASHNTVITTAYSPGQGVSADGTNLSVELSRLSFRQVSNLLNTFSTSAVYQLVPLQWLWLPLFPVATLGPSLVSFVVWPYTYYYFNLLVGYGNVHFATKFICLTCAVAFWLVAAMETPAGAASGKFGGKLADNVSVLWVGTVRHFLPQLFWLTIALFVLAAMRISSATLQTLQAHSTESSDQKYKEDPESRHALTSSSSLFPKHLYRVKQIEEVCRLFLVNGVIVFLVKPLLRLCNYVIPNRLQYWMYPTPVLNLGPRCDYGIAYQVNGRPQQEPVVFQYNVGHFGGSNYDYLRTSTATRDMMEELLDDPEAGKLGFVADTVAVFPLGRGGARTSEGADPVSAAAVGSNQANADMYHFREINLSAWTSQKAAFAWYKQSKTHKQIVKDYHSGDLEEFSAMLATLVPPAERPIRWEIRCRECRAMAVDRATNKCTSCSANYPAPLPYL